MSDDPYVVRVTESEFSLHEEDEWLKGEIVGVEYVPAEQNKLYGKPQFKWVLHLDDDPEDQEVWYFTGAKLSNDPRNKLRKTIKALTGEVPSAEEPYDVRDFVGVRVKVMFERYTTTDSDGGTVEREKIAAIKGLG